MTHYHAVMTDETGCEFGVGVEADSKEKAEFWLREMYPESSIAQLESPEDTRQREARIQRDVQMGIDYDDEGRPINHYPEYDDDDEYCDRCGMELNTDWCPECD